MTEWQATKRVGLFQLKQDWPGAAGTLLFALYTSGMMSLSIRTMMADEEPAAAFVMIDWMYVTIFPFLGLLFNRTAFSIWSNDHFSRRLAHLRTLPIPPRAIVRVRALQHILLLLVIGTVFQALPYAIAPGLREAAGWADWAAFSLVWICYGIVVNAWLMWLETGHRGKVFVIGYIGYMVAATAAIALLKWQRVDVFAQLLDASQSRSAWLWIWPPLAAAAATWWGYKASVRRMLSRSYSL